MAGGPSHLETFDFKPKLARDAGQADARELHQGPADRPAPGARARAASARSRTSRSSARAAPEICELFPKIGSVADDICIIRSMTTEAINHDPAHTFMNTGTTISGRPSMGSWITYGLGSDADNLPGFVVLTSQGRGGQNQPIASRQWHSGFLPSRFQGVQFRGQGDPVLYLSRPDGRQRRPAARRGGRGARSSNGIENAVGGRPGNRHAHQPVRDGLRDAEQRAGADGPVEASRRRSWRCTAPRAPTAPSPPTACWPAAWPSAACASSSSTTATGTTTATSRTTSSSRPRKWTRPPPPSITDLKNRGMLDDTLVVWGGEFGRTPMAQGNGRDHHIKGFSMLARRRRHQGRHHPRRHRRLGLQRRRGRRRGPRPARDDALPAGHRPQEADHQVPGPRLPPDGRAGEVVQKILA